VRNVKFNAKLIGDLFYLHQNSDECEKLSDGPCVVLLGCCESNVFLCWHQGCLFVGRQDVGPGDGFDVSPFCSFGSGLLDKAFCLVKVSSVL